MADNTTETNTETQEREYFVDNYKDSNDINWLVANTGNNPLVNYNFMLRVEGLYDVPCKSVQAFTRENEYEYIKEGGLNDYVHLKRKPISKPFQLVVERYAAVDYIDPLPLGSELALPLILMVSRYNNEFGGAKRTYTFTGCVVMSKEYGELDAEKSGLLTERITIGYREMVVVDLEPGIEFSPKTYSIEKNGTKNVKALTDHNSTYVDTTGAKATAADTTYKWSFSNVKDPNARHNINSTDTSKHVDTNGVEAAPVSNKYKWSFNNIDDKNARHNIANGGSSVHFTVEDKKSAAAAAEGSEAPKGRSSVSIDKDPYSIKNGITNKWAIVDSNEVRKADMPARKWLPLKEENVSVETEGGNTEA